MLNDQGYPSVDRERAGSVLLLGVLHTYCALNPSVIMPTLFALGSYRYQLEGFALDAITGFNCVDQ